MKTRNLLITLGAAAFAAITINATAANQIKQVSGTANDANTVVVNTAAISPRAADNQIVTVAGRSSDVNSAVACAKIMNGTPKAIQACVEHTTMPGCQTVTIADAK